MPDDARAEVYDGDELSFPDHGEPSGERLPHGPDYTGELFDGYPQVVRNEESEPEYDVVKEEDVMVALRDGVRLAVDVYRPDTTGEFPAIVAWGMWNKDVQDAVAWLKDEPQAYLESPFWDGTLEAGDYTYLVPRGYVHVIPNPRGIGDSEGDFSMETAHDPADVSEVIEWVADQPWADGSVGMIGPSSYSLSQLLVASDPPEPLEAIFPWGNLPSTGEHFDGIFDTVGHHILVGRHGNDAGLPASNRAFTVPTPTMVETHTEEELEARIDEAASHPDIRYNSKWYSYLMNPYKWPPGTFDRLLSAYSEPHWQARAFVVDESVIEAVEVPLWTGSPWCTDVYLWSTMETWRAVGTPHEHRKLLLGGYPAHGSRPFTAFHDEMVRWFDHWLKGEATGVLDEPPIKLHVLGIDRWKFEEEWPLARTDWTRFYLQPGGGLGTDRPDPDAPPETFTQPAPYQDSTVYCLRYSTAPFSSATEVTGPLALCLEAAIDHDDTNWLVDLVDLAPDGERQLVSRGSLKAQYRALDEAASEPWRPVHPAGEPEPVPQGEPVEYAIAMLPTSVVFEADHRMELVLRNQDDLKSTEGLNGAYKLPFMATVTHEVHFGDSHLYLPVIE